MAENPQEAARVGGEQAIPSNPSSRPASTSDLEKQGDDVDGAADLPVQPTPVNPMDPSQFPDGGLKAWTVVFGAWCGLFVSFGWINCTP